MANFYLRIYRNAHAPITASSVLGPLGVLQYIGGLKGPSNGIPVIPAPLVATFADHGRISVAANAPNLIPGLICQKKGVLQPITVNSATASWGIGVGSVVTATTEQATMPGGLLTAGDPLGALDTSQAMTRFIAAGDVRPTLSLRTSGFSGSAQLFPLNPTFITPNNAGLELAGQAVYNLTSLSNTLAPSSNVDVLFEANPVFSSAALSDLVAGATANGFDATKICLLASLVVDLQIAIPDSIISPTSANATDTWFIVGDCAPEFTSTLTRLPAYGFAAHCAAFNPAMRNPGTNQFCDNLFYARVPWLTNSGNQAGAERTVLHTAAIKDGASNYDVNVYSRVEMRGVPFTGALQLPYPTVTGGGTPGPY